MAMVLKTIVAATSPWVRIPRPPLLTWKTGSDLDWAERSLPCHSGAGVNHSGRPPVHGVEGDGRGDHAPPRNGQTSPGGCHARTTQGSGDSGSDAHRGPGASAVSICERRYDATAGDHNDGFALRRR